MDVNDECLDDNCSYGSWRAVVSFGLAAICLAVFVVTMLFIVVVFTTRKFTYNIYVISLLLPDALLNLILGIRCVYDGMENNEHAAPISLCTLQQIGIALYISNVYLNAVIGHEIYVLVWNSYRRRRIQQPTLKKVLLQVLAVYSFAGLFCAWCTLPVDWSLMTVVNEPYCGVTYGSAMVPSWVNNLVFGVLIPPPVCYFLWTYHKLIRGGFLPIKGRTRALALYFLRIIGIFLFFYIPMSVVTVAYNNTPPERHDSTSYFLLQAIFTLMNPIQNMFSIVIFLQKDDIRLVIKEVASSLKISSRLFLSSKFSAEWKMEDTYNDHSNDSDDDRDGDGDGDAGSPGAKDRRKSSSISMSLLISALFEPMEGEMITEMEDVDDADIEDVEDDDDDDDDDDINANGNDNIDIDIDM